MSQVTIDLERLQREAANTQGQLERAIAENGKLNECNTHLKRQLEGYTSQVDRLNNEVKSLQGKCEQNELASLFSAPPGRCMIHSHLSRW